MLARTLVLLVLCSPAAVALACRDHSSAAHAKPETTTLDASRSDRIPSDGPERQETAVAAKAGTVGVTGSVAVVGNWLGAFRKHDGTGLATLTLFPFALRDTGTEGDCKTTTLAKAELLQPGLVCLTNDELVQEALRANPEPLTKVLSRKTLPKWARRWAGELREGMTPVSVYVPGNGSAFEFVLIVVGDQIQGLWKHATFESN
jgi:hypothetical protein